MSEIQDLVCLIEEVSGNVVPERDHQRLEAIARDRVRSSGATDLQTYLGRLRSSSEGGEWRTLLSLITVNESYLFRSPDQFDALAEQMIPELTKRRPEQKLRLWSAGCACGEEAATIAVVLAESPRLTGWDWRVVATDVDESALATARTGRYGPRAVSKVPQDLLQRYFEPRGKDFELCDGLRQRIEYRSLNLVREPLLVPRSSFDVVFLRNVLIYFRPSSQIRVAGSVAATLREDGYLFLGTSESLWQQQTSLHPVEIGRCFCYRRTLPETRISAREQARPAVVFEKEAPAPPPSPPSTRAGAPALGSNGAATKLRMTVRETIVDSLAGADLELTGGLIADATKCYPEDPVLRALEGLYHDVKAEDVDAVRAYRAALYLDPFLFQVRLLLARCLVRLGQRGSAAREYRHVLATASSNEARTFPGSRRLGLPDAEHASEQVQEILIG